MRMYMQGTRKRVRLYVPRKPACPSNGFTSIAATQPMPARLPARKATPVCPALLAPDRWQFWMQTSRHPIEEGLHGFAMETAVTQIDARGYYLFTGSPQLLATRVVARAAIPNVSIIATSTHASSTPQ